jgi:hypothetical protein
VPLAPDLVTARVCGAPGCGTVLSRYNAEPYCWVHQRFLLRLAEVPDEAERIRLAEEEAARLPTRQLDEYVIRALTLGEKTVTQLSEEVGVTRHRVHSSVARLRRLGRIVVAREVRIGFGGYANVWRLA